MTLKLHSTATIIKINEPLEHYKYIINTGILYGIVYSGNLSSASTAVFFHCCPKFFCRTRSYSRFPLPVAPGLTQGPCSLLPWGLAQSPCSFLLLQIPARCCTWSRFGSLLHTAALAAVRWHQTAKIKKGILSTIPINHVLSASSVVNPALLFLTMLLGGRMKESFLETIVRMSQLSLVPAFVWLIKKRQNALTLHSTRPNGASLSQYLLESTKSVLNHVVTPRRS